MRTYTDACERMQMQTHSDAHRHMQMHADERKANCIQCVGKRNLKMHPDIRRLFKDFQNVLQIHVQYTCVYVPIQYVRSSQTKQWPSGLFVC